MIVWLLACASTEDLADVREACGLDAGQHVPLPYGREEVPHPISTACAEHLVDDAHVGWGTFSADPVVGFDVPEDIGQAVVAGLFALVAADEGSVGELEAAAGDDEALTLLLAELREDGDVDGAEDANVVPWRWLTERVQTVRWNEYPANMSTSGYSIDVNLDGDTLGDTHTRPVAIAAVLVHEMAHGVVGQHTAGNSGDADGNGAYGAQARWLATWLDRNAASVEPEDCADVETMRERKCGQIADVGGFAPCGIEPPCAAE